MKYQTVEVELQEGQVRACNAEPLPAKAHALLTILENVPAQTTTAPGRTLGQAMRKLGVTGHGNFTDLSTNKSHLGDFGK